MVHRQMGRLSVGLAIFVVLGSVNVARGAFVAVVNGANLPDTDASTANAKYKVNFNSGSVAYDSADVNEGGRVQQGTIKITDTWPNMDCGPHELTFMQTETPPGGFQAGQGLRLQLEFMITNQSGKSWRSFWIKTSETVPANTTNESMSHQHHAHFHANEGPPPGTPMVAGMTGFTTVDVPDNSRMSEVKGGLHATGKMFNTKGFFLHERNLMNGAQGVPRTFKLILMPHCVPEPSSLLLMMMLSGVGLVRTVRGVREHTT